MNMGVAKSRCGVTLGLGPQRQAAGVFQMNSLSDEPKVEAITVVLVEDDAPTLWRLQDVLTKAGYQVRAAGTLTEARACLAQGAPKVLLTDLQLPDGHGVDLIRETRERFPDTEIMVISILGDEESVISAITVGATVICSRTRFRPTSPPPSATSWPGIRRSRPRSPASSCA